MKTPEFWRSKTFTADMLAPFSIFTFFGARIREALKPSKQLRVPVICIGNAIAGGSGKTPVCIALVNQLKEHHKIAVICKSYKARITSPTLVDVSSHKPDEVGDEPLLIARHAECWVGGDRFETALAAMEAGANLLILDDGLQNPGIKKDFSLLVIDGKIGFGNRYLIPAGPLRDRPDIVFNKSNVIVMIGEDKDNLLDLYKPQQPTVSATIQPDKSCLRQLRGRPVIAFAGIGYPEKFFDMLKQNDMELVDSFAFADHHQYTSDDQIKLTQKAKELNAQLVTTEKDAVKMNDAFLKQCVVLPISIEFENYTALQQLIAEAGIK